MVNTKIYDCYDYWHSERLQQNNDVMIIYSELNSEHTAYQFVRADRLWIRVADYSSAYQCLKHRDQTLAILHQLNAGTQYQYTVNTEQETHTRTNLSCVHCTINHISSKLYTATDINFDTTAAIGRKDL